MAETGGLLVARIPIQYAFIVCVAANLKAGVAARGFRYTVVVGVSAVIIGLAARQLRVGLVSRSDRPITCSGGHKERRTEDS